MRYTAGIPEFSPEGGQQRPQHLIRIILKAASSYPSRGPPRKSGLTDAKTTGTKGAVSQRDTRDWHFIFSLTIDEFARLIGADPLPRPWMSRHLGAVFTISSKSSLFLVFHSSSWSSRPSYEDGRRHRRGDDTADSLSFRGSYSRTRARLANNKNTNPLVGSAAVRSVFRPRFADHQNSSRQLASSAREPERGLSSRGN